MGCHEKFCYIRTRDVQKHYYGVVLHKLLYTRRDRSRGIRDDATACEPEVASRKRTWPPQPVAQPSRATGRPFGKKYDNIDHNKAKRKVPGALEAKPEVEIWRRRDCFLLADPDFLSDLQHITVSISYRYPVLQC